MCLWVPQPKCVNLYHEYIGGVDLHDLPSYLSGWGRAWTFQWWALLEWGIYISRKTSTGLGLLCCTHSSTCGQYAMCFGITAVADLFDRLNTYLYLWPRAALPSAPLAAPHGSYGLWLMINSGQGWGGGIIISDNIIPAMICLHKFSICIQQCGWQMACLPLIVHIWPIAVTASFTFWGNWYIIQ